MPLYDIEGRRQSAIGHGDHWRTFPAFIETPLHQAFVQETRALLGQDRIDSRIEGQKIIDALRAHHARHFESYSEEQVGGLWGMTLWHFMDEQPEDWTFYRPVDAFDETHRWTVYWPVRNR